MYLALPVYINIGYAEYFDFFLYFENYYSSGKEILYLFLIGIKTSDDRIHLCQKNGDK